jgi:hypothetical protein
LGVFRYSDIQNILGDYLTFSSAPPKLDSSSTGKNENAKAAAFQRSWSGSLALTVSKTFRQGIAKNNKIGAGTVSNIQVMTLYPLASRKNMMICYGA